MPNEPKPADQQPQPAPPAGMMRGDAKDDAGGFDAARARAKQRVRDEDAKLEKDRNLKQKAEAQADQIIKGVDLESLAKEVDEDFSMASKFRNLRKMTPDAEKKLAEIRQRVLERRKSAPAENKEMKKENPTAGAAPAAGGAPASPTSSTTNNPQTAGSQAGSASSQTGQQAPAAPANGQTPPASTDGKQPAAPAPSDEFTKKLDELRKEFDTKLTTQQAAMKKLEDENAKLKMEKQKAEEQRKIEAEKQRVASFKTAAQAAGIPEDLAEFAYGKAQDVVNASGVKMTYAQIFEKLKEKHPSIFHTKSVKPEASEKPSEQPKEEQKFQVKPGTGSPTGGASSKPQAPKKEELGADSWDASRQKLKKRVASMQ